jgi:dTMP kinase
MSTQLNELARRAREVGGEVVTAREPGGTALGEALRGALFADREPKPGDRAELLIFGAARAQLVSEVIRPALAAGALVICDRFADSTVAYQHYGRGIDLDTVRAVNAAATDGTWPDLTILLDLDPKDGLARGERGSDYLERETLDFHQRVRDGFLELAAAEPDRWLVIDATKPPQEITDEVWQRIESMMRVRSGSFGSS